MAFSYTDSILQKSPAAGNPQNIIDASPYMNQSQNKIVSHLSQTV